MRLLTILLLLLLVPLAACRQAPVPEQPTAAPPVVPSATPIDASPAVTSAPTDQIFVPVAPGEAVSATTGYPAPSPNPSQGEGDSTATPAPPTPTPEPAYPEYTGPPLNRDEVGIQIYLHRQDVRDLLRHFQALGVGWVKVQVSWKLHEPRPGEYNEELFGELDRLVAGANGQDVKVLLSVSKAPEWSRPTTEMDGPPSDYGQFEGFMRYLAMRYSGQVAAYELWNEPNLQSASGTARPSARPTSWT